jgi:hypothetical protein
MIQFNVSSMFNRYDILIVFSPWALFSIYFLYYWSTCQYSMNTPYRYAINPTVLLEVGDMIIIQFCVVSKQATYLIVLDFFIIQVQELI